MIRYRNQQPKPENT